MNLYIYDWNLYMESNMESNMEGVCINIYIYMIGI